MSVTEENEALRPSVVITTKNRKDELRCAIRSVIKQTVQVEIIVIDDGSTDGTSDMVRSEFPEVRLSRSEVSRGLIAQRNKGAQLASGNIIFSIDDDAIFVSERTVEQTLSSFDDFRVGAVAIPYIEPKKSHAIHQRATEKGVQVTSSFIGTAHALRKDIFQSLCGYREYLVHQGEEEDYCIRLLNRGYFVRLGDADPIHHMESPRRDLSRMDYYGARNSILFVYQNVPLIFAPFFFVVTTFKVISFTLVPMRLRTRLRGVLDAYRDCFRGRISRKPVSIASFLIFRRLRKSFGLPLQQLDECLQGFKAREEGAAQISLAH